MGRQVSEQAGRRQDRVHISFAGLKRRRPRVAIWAVSVCLVCMFGTFVATLPFYLDSTAFCHVSNVPCGAAGSFYGTDVGMDHGCGLFISCFNALSGLTSVSGEELGYRWC